MPFSDGDFLLVEYTVRVKETGNIVDTTSEEIARSENIYESGRLYGPVLVVLGKKWLNEMVEEELKNMDVGEEKEIIVPPEKAFGPRDPGKVKVYSLREFRRRNLRVSVGDVVEIGGSRGIVKGISGGRVIVDFNHPLAGKTLIFKVKVVSKIEDFTGKVKALATRHLQIPMDDVDVDYDEENKELTITIPSKYIARKNLQYGKISLAADIHSFFKDKVNRLVYKEIIEINKPEKKEEEKAGETGGEGEEAQPPAETSSGETKE